VIHIACIFARLTPPAPCPVSDVRQVFHADESHTVGHRKVDDLTVTLVVVVFHPPGFLILGFADGFQLLGLAQLSPSGNVPSTYVCTVIAFEELR
jgi:hypothetical protein